jgi:hypothetical protein
VRDALSAAALRAFVRAHNRNGVQNLRMTTWLGYARRVLYHHG